ncbi:hypothetical protein DXG03_005195 [Asterophora parasitica]|uniref:Cytoplasmic protein n=1 Tax=Asterophora parasitica TaxID=117018 RepID=A0A9P7KCR8_9AGAR|nr:hypothetical protein DXG03_005195 [Asterophora parasitica]
MSDVLTNIARPKTSATLTVRIIKSFEYRTERSLVLHELNLETTTVGDLKDIARKAVQAQPGWKPYRNVTLGLHAELQSSGASDLSRYAKALHHGPWLQGNKIYKAASCADSRQTTNLIINLDNDHWILDDDQKTLAELQFENETEVSFFNRELYEQFKQNPTTSWD